jgi:uncharacterized protein (DUF58 family)
MFQTDVPLHDPTALAKFGKLDVIARLIVEGYMIGQHKSPFKGSSVEFVEHRQYYPGDEIRHIDWRAFGKTGRYYIKEFEEETNLRAYLFVDASGSMGYGESTLSKFEYARLLAASLGHLLISQRDAVGLMTFDGQVRDRIEPSTNPKNFQLITTALEHCETGEETSLGAFFERAIPTLKRRSLVIIMSDFFDDLQALRQALQMFKRNRHEVVLFQILAPEEEDFPFTRPTQFRSLEQAGHRLLVDPHRLRAVYLEQLHKFQNELTQIVGRCGFDSTKMLTTEPFDKALGAYLDSRTRQSKKMK